jgi:hypothetical protein
MDRGTNFGQCPDVAAICAHPSVQCVREQHLDYLFEDYDEGEEQYIGELAILHEEHMEYFLLGLISTENFLPETVEEVYFGNLYALSWFYDGVYLFDSYKLDMELYLNEKVYERMIEAKVDAKLASYSDFL